MKSNIFTIEKTIRGFSEYTFSLIQTKFSGFERTITRIPSTEHSLNSGRFLRFVKELSNANEVHIDMTGVFWPNYTLINSNMFTWIGENVYNEWTLYVDLLSDNIQAIHKFGFKSEAEAMHFTLKWK